MSAEISKTLQSALLEIWRHEDRPNASPYWWRRASMLKLRDLGYVEGYRSSSGDGAFAFKLTPSGKALALELLK